MHSPRVHYTLRMRLTIANQTIVDAARRYDLPILEPASLSFRKRWLRSLPPFLGNLGRTPNGDRQTAST